MIALCVACPLACRAGTAVTTGPTPVATASSVASAPPVPSAMSTPAVATASRPDSPAPGPSAPIVRALAVADPGPGLVGCGAVACHAGAEVCAPTQACGKDWPAQGCVPIAELRARTFELDEPAATGAGGCFRCYEWFDSKACDGAGDCAQGEICCHERTSVLGDCFARDGDDGFVDRYECKPQGAGPTPCGAAEICSLEDPTCSRRGSTCVVHGSTGTGTCDAPRSGPRCGAARCARGLVCVEVAEGERSCVQDPTAYGDEAIVECDGGRDCAPDEACFTMGHRHCALGASSWAGSDLPICRDAADCVGYCKGNAALATCRQADGRGICECRPSCTRDADCTKAGDYCLGPLNLNRHGGALLPLTPFCDQKQRRCDCRD